MLLYMSVLNSYIFAGIAQEAERILGKDEVGSSNLPISSKVPNALSVRNFTYYIFNGYLYIFNFERIKSMKKLLVLLISALILLSTTACGGSNMITTISTVVPEYKNDEFSDLSKYLIENKLINEEAVVIEYSYIEADEG